jgi:hypothetical protein
MTPIVHEPEPQKIVNNPLHSSAGVGMERQLRGGNAFAVSVRIP